MIIIDVKTKEIIANICGSTGTLDAALHLLQYTADDDGQIRDDNGELLNAWYDDLESSYHFFPDGIESITEKDKKEILDYLEIN